MEWCRVFVCFCGCVCARSRVRGRVVRERGSGEMITEMLQQETEMWFMAIVIAGGMETLWRSRGSAKEPYARRPYGIIRSKQQMASNSR